VVRTRLLALGVVAAGLVVSLSGCNASSLSKVELVVYFGPNAPQSDHIAALRACSHVSPETVPEPIETASNLASDVVGDVRFRIDHANDKEIAQLTECLNKQPGVVGVDTPDLSD
jgi:hypothetical protein